jgi:hypothetical protein
MSCADDPDHQEERMTSLFEASRLRRLRVRTLPLREWRKDLRCPGDIDIPESMPQRVSPFAQRSR